MKSVAIINQKGGVGKTTTVTNTGAALASRGHKTLIVDLDPQGNLTQGLGIKTDTLPKSIYHLLTGEISAPSEIIQNVQKNLDILPSNLYLAGAEHTLSNTPGGELVLRELFEHPDIQAYDYLLVDCPPSLGKLTINALVAVDSVIITVEAEFYALQGVATLFTSINMVQKRINPNLKVLGAVITKYDGRQKLHREVQDAVRTTFGKSVFKSTIRKNVDLAGAPAQGATIFDFRPGSYGAEDYRAFADELLETLEVKHVHG